MGNEDDSNGYKTNDIKIKLNNIKLKLHQKSIAKDFDIDYNRFIDEISYHLLRAELQQRDILCSCSEHSVLYIVSAHGQEAEYKVRSMHNENVRCN